MKKYLYATTAMVGVGLAAGSAQAAEGIKIGLSGFMNTYYGVSSRDKTAAGEGDKSVSHFQDATINFIGSTTLDNGIEVGVRFELESFGHPADEQFMWFSGSFGEITLGGINSAAYRMSFDAGPPIWDAGIPINSGWINTFIPAPDGYFTQFRAPSLSTYVDTHNDANTVAYFSPRFSGFQFGASWTPETGGTPQGQFGPVDEEIQFNNAISVGASYVQSFDGVDLGLHAGYNLAQEPDNNNAISNGLGAQAGGNDDRDQIMAGISLGFGGFRVGANWAQEDHDVNVGNQSADGNAYSVGASYSTGPWSFAVNSFFSEITGDPTNPEEDEVTAITGGVNYALGPGITVKGAVLYVDWDEEGGVSEDAVAGILGTTVTF